MRYREMTITVTTKRELTKEEERLVLEEVYRKRKEWLAFVRGEDGYGEEPDEDRILENSFDANIIFETEQVIKELMKAGQLFVSAEDVVMLSISLKVEGDEECK
jgi:hypothetical protein